MAAKQEAAVFDDHQAICAINYKEYRNGVTKLYIYLYYAFGYFCTHVLWLML